MESFLRLESDREVGLSSLTASVIARDGVRGCYQTPQRSTVLSDAGCKPLSVRTSRNAHLVECIPTFWALDYMRRETHQFVGLNLVPAHWAGLREVEVGFSLKPRCHHPTHPSAVRTDFRIVRGESRPRNTSDGRYRLTAPQSGHLAAMGWAGTDSTGAGMFSRQPLHWTTTRFELSGPGNMVTSIGEYTTKVIYSR